MKFPLTKYEEVDLKYRNTMQIFITNNCNFSCKGCFARKVIKTKIKNMSISEYKKAINLCVDKNGKQVNLLGGEPLLHPKLKELIKIAKDKNLKITIYTNGALLNNYKPNDFTGVKIRVSIYSLLNHKAVISIPKTNIEFDANFMVSNKTTTDELLKTARYAETNYNCKNFFISSIRELDNKNKEFFEDTEITMPLLKYKKIIHSFLCHYEGTMTIHISKRGVFESTKTLALNKCRFVNYFIGGKIIQCPYDVVNLKYQKDFQFNTRHCQHNNTCLMSKLIFRKRKRLNEK